MPRLIDADIFYDNIVEGTDLGAEDNVDEALKRYLDLEPTVETIPKADYENRLKADLKAILVELQLEIEGHQESILGRYDNTVPERDKPMMKLARNEGRKECKNLIQQKINSLKEA